MRLWGGCSVRVQARLVYSGGGTLSKGMGPASTRFKSEKRAFVLLILRPGGGWVVPPPSPFLRSGGAKFADESRATLPRGWIDFRNTSLAGAHLDDMWIRSKSSRASFFPRPESTLGWPVVWSWKMGQVFLLWQVDQWRPERQRIIGKFGVEF